MTASENVWMAHTVYLCLCMFLDIVTTSTIMSFALLSQFEVQRNDEFERDVAAHIKDALTTSHPVEVGIFQSTQVVLVGAVQQVIGRDVELSYLLAVQVDVCAC